MKAMAWAAVAVLIAGLIIAEVAMDLGAADRSKLYAVFGGMAVLTFATSLALVRLARRTRTLINSLRMVAFGAVTVTALVVAAGAFSMIIDRHDLSVVLVALLLGVGLGGVLAAAVGESLTSDLAAISQTAHRVEEGDLGARIRAERSDELGLAANAFDEMVARLQANEAERRDLLASISHDLRTPLASMQAAVEALQDGLAPDPAAYLRGLSHDLDYLRRLVDDLFLLARLDAGRLELSPTEVDLAELADEAVEAVAPVAASHSVRVRVEGPGRVGVVADPAAMGRVFRNLLSNAVRHSPRDGEVKVQLSLNGSTVEALVADQGTGFEENPPARAFERFARSDASRSRDSGGNGLGLAIAKGIVEAHGGSIAIESGPGGRVRFTIPHQA